VSDQPTPQPTSPAASSGLSDNAAGALAYVTIIPAIIFLVMEPYNRNPFIKFHAWQNIFLCVVVVVLGVIGIIPILGWIIFFVGWLAVFVFWIIAILQASKGVKYKIPVIGNIAEKQANS
jgi:uncharacterized membrane protein